VTEESLPQDGGPAFPSNGAQDGEGLVRYLRVPGMSLRDWFASMATDTDIWNIRYVFKSKMGRDGTDQELRYFHADAMLAARTK